MVPTDKNRPRHASLLARLRAWLESDTLVPRARPQAALASPPSATEHDAEGFAHAPAVSVPIPKDWVLTRTRRRLEHENRILSHTHVDNSLLLLLEELRQQRARPVARDRVPFQAQDLHLQRYEREGTATEITEFSFQGERYRVELDTGELTTGAGDAPRGKLRLFQGDRLVVMAHVSRAQAGAAPGRWDSLKVETLKPGAWVKHIAEIEEQIRYVRETPLLQTELQRIMEVTEEPPKTR